MDLIKKNTILKQNTDKYTKYICAFILMHLSVFQVVAQTPPDVLPVGGDNLTLLNATAGDPESIDTVVVGSTLPYYVYPDFDFNPSFIESTPLDSSKIDSKFFWSSDAGYVVNTVNATDPENYKNITWNIKGNYAIKVTEKTDALYGGCSGDYNFKVVVLDKPTATFTSAATITCPQTVATDISLPIKNTSGVKLTTENEKHVQYTVNMSYNGGAATPVTVPAVESGATSVVVSLSSLPEGRYVFTLTKVSDRISRKCSIDGTLGAQTTYIMYVTTPKPTLTTSTKK